ncbi:MAG: PepSY domain-containing protein [Planctomycetota bacterium]|nr:PepSY domain-containing protein [Planctomycetota bacterium]
MSAAKWNRNLHRWGAIGASLPLLVIVVSGLFLQLKKESDWIQPPTKRGSSRELAIGFDAVLEAARGVPEAGVRSWDDVDRLDVRPGKGVIKVRCNNRWEIQVDTKTGVVLQVAERRSDLIESIHDGSFFHDAVKLWVFLPAAVVLAGLWGTGIYLFLLPHLARRRRNQQMRSA